VEDVACHVLVVDDDTECLALMGDVIKNAGVRDVSLTKSAPDALAILTATNIDVVVTDIALADARRDGVWLLEQMKASLRLNHIPVVAFTGYSGRQRELAAHGFVAVLTKPVDAVELGGIVVSTFCRCRDSAAARYLE
jgi:CheY-like chemotaxis protein